MNKQYKVIEQRKTVAGEGEDIITLVNKETATGVWKLHTIDLAFGRAVLEQEVEDTG